MYFYFLCGQVLSFLGITPGLHSHSQMKCNFRKLGKIFFYVRLLAGDLLGLFSMSFWLLAGGIFYLDEFANFQILSMFFTASKMGREPTLPTFP